MKAFRLADLREEQPAPALRYLELHRSDSLSIGRYVLRVGEVDRQRPHLEDEVYVVIRGRSRFTAGEEVSDVSPGDVIYVAAHVPHLFHDITEDLELIVVFAPPETPL